MDNDNLAENYISKYLKDDKRVLFEIEGPRFNMNLKYYF